MSLSSTEKTITDGSNSFPQKPHVTVYLCHGTSDQLIKGNWAKEKIEKGFENAKLRIRTDFNILALNAHN